MTIKEIKIQIALGSLPIADKLALAGDKKTSKKILTILSKDKMWTVRDGVAENLNTSKEVLKILSTDRDWYVRRWVASNPNTPKEVLKKLSKDENWCVRCNAECSIRTRKRETIE